MSLRLPARPHLDLLKRQAKAALRVGRLLYPSWRLADAQRALAKGYGAANWTALKHDVAARRRAPRPADAEAAGPNPEAATRSRVLEPFVGSWISCPGHDERVALEIADAAGAVQLTQVQTGGAGDGTASSLLLWADGRERPLPFGDGLRLRATWSGDCTLDTIITHGHDTVAHGAYVVSNEGRTLSVTAAGRRFVFAKAGAAVLAAALISSGCAEATARKGLSTRHPQHDADRQAIEALNRHDVAAAMASDVEAVVSQWTEDFVVMPPAGPIVRGRAANAALIAGAREQIAKFEPTAYDVSFDEIVIAGDYAFAWGRFRTVARPRAGGSDVVSSGKLLRIYQRQPDGRWLMHRTMSTMDPPRP